jgi:hypothetical protein
MAGPFARLRRGGQDATQPEAATEAVPAVDAEAPATTEVVEADATAPDAAPSNGFLARGQLRRRLRYVRRAREVALRDLGGLVFDLHRFQSDRTDLVDQKLAALSAIDAEMRGLAAELDDRRDITVLREPGLASCPRCGALHASDARFCSTCGLPVGQHAGLPAGPTPSGPAADQLAVVPADAPAPGAERPTAT